MNRSKRQEVIGYRLEVIDIFYQLQPKTYYLAPANSQREVA